MLLHRRVLGFMVAGGVVVLTLTLFLSRRHPEVATGPSTPNAMGGAAGKGTTEDRPGEVVPGQTEADVDRIVADRNRASRREAERFQADGWEITRGGAPPDGRVTGLDPTLIAQGREEELRVQLASTIASPDSIGRLAEIAVLSREPATRYHAIDSLARLRTEAAQLTLIDLYQGKLAGDDEARSAIVGRLRPTDLDDAVAARMVKLLDSQNTPNADKDQLAFMLGVVSLRDGMEVTSASPAALARIADMKAKAQRGIVAENHAH